MPAHTASPPSESTETDTDEYIVGELEHELRVAFSVGGAETGMDMAVTAIENWKNKDVPILKYLKGKRDTASADLAEAFEPLVEKNLDFYSNIEENLESRLDRAQERMRYDELYFESHMVVDTEDELKRIPDEKNPLHVSELDGAVDLSDRKFSFPTPLLCAHSDRRNSSIYPFIPADETDDSEDVLMCTCKDKQYRSDSPLCFHEIAALLEVNSNDLDVTGPETWTQLVSPKGYNN